MREDPSGRSYARTLNLLLSRAHNTIYTGQKSSAKGILHFYRETYPQVFRRNLGLVSAACLLFVIGGLAGMLISVTHPQFMHQFLGPHMMETIDQHKMWTDSVVSVKPAAASGIMTNNMSVSFAAFAFGITAGLGTIYMMVFNGVMMGVVGSGLLVRRHEPSAVELCGARMACWSCRQFLLPAELGCESPRGCCFPGCLRGAIRWQKPVARR